MQFVFDWDGARAAALVAAEGDGRRVVEAFAEETKGQLLADKDSFRAVMNRVKERTGLKGKAIFHPVRVALTGAESGPELDLAVPAIDRGSQLPSGAGVMKIVSCHERAVRSLEG